MSTEALIVIDMQNDYYSDGKMPLCKIDKAHKNAVDIVKYARDSKIKVIFIQHIASVDDTFFVPNSIGVQIHNDFDMQENEMVIQKHYPNSFRETDLHKYLQERCIKKLIICGAMTHMCVDTTVRAAYDLGYEVELAGDATATKDLNYGSNTVSAEDVQSAYLAALNGTFCKVVSSQQIISC